MLRYPFENVRESEDRIINWIASVVFDEDNPRQARDKVRQRIRYAKANFDATVFADLNSPKFFEWAVKSWPKLSNVTGFPVSRRGSLVTHGLVQGGDLSSAPVVQFPADTDANSLRQLYKKSETERQALEVALKNSESRISALEAELAEFKSRQNARIEKNRESGKKGGKAKKNQ